MRQDAKSLSNGLDQQLERAVEELLKQIGDEPEEIKMPAFSKPAKEIRWNQSKLNCS